MGKPIHRHLLPGEEIPGPGKKVNQKLRKKRIEDR